MRVLTLLSSPLFCSFLSTLVLAEERIYNFNIGWVTRNPDGRHERRVIGINGEWPLPQIEATVGDRIIVNVQNNLDRPTSLHFHGLFQNGTTHMDGAIGTTQCPIPVGASFVYDFVVDQPGTYWYHSHETAQYPDGLRGALIVHDPQNPYKDLYDEEIVLTLSDWYHTEMPQIMDNFWNVANPTGAEPVPQSSLQNDKADLKTLVVPGKTYFLRIINLGAFAGQYFWIEGHDLKIIELDGVYHEPTDAKMLYISAAQRIGVLFTAKKDSSKNYAVVAAMDQELFDVIPDDLLPNSTSHLVYDSSKPFPEAKFVDEFEPADDFGLVPTDHQALFEKPVKSIVLDVDMQNLGDGKNYAFFNNITYKEPVVPTIFTLLSATEELVAESAIYGSHTNTIILEQNQVFEIVLNNHDDGKHPFHMHGHEFQLLARSEEDAGDWDPEATGTLPETPTRRDTVLVYGNGHAVIRFRSDNPGIWQFHCHIEWHMKQGLVLILVEAPQQLKQSLHLPKEHYSICAAANIPTTGNAAGNHHDFLDLKGENAPPAPLPAGFTIKGVIALIFSIISGILGTVVIFWYSLGEEEEKLGHGDGGEEGGELLGENDNEDGEGRGVLSGRVPDETVSLLRS